jgi:predicted enzyme related to lactoylglutathione lyase
VLGEPGFRDGEWWGWENGGGIMIGNHSEVHGASAQPQRIMLSFEVDDVKATFEAITGFGATVIAEPYQPDDGMDNWLATFADPDGNYFQLMSPWEY